MIAVFQYLMGYYRKEAMDLSSMVTETRIRNNGLKFYKEKSKLEIRRTFLTMMAIKQFITCLLGWSITGGLQVKVDNHLSRML